MCSVCTLNIVLLLLRIRFHVEFFPCCLCCCYCGNLEVVESSYFFNFQCRCLSSCSPSHQVKICEMRQRRHAQQCVCAVGDARNNQTFLVNEKQGFLMHGLCQQVFLFCFHLPVWCVHILTLWKGGVVFKQFCQAFIAAF